MKYTIMHILALAGPGTAIPHPHFNFPGFSVPSFSLPTAGFGAGTGSSLNSGLESVPVATSGPRISSGLGNGFDWASLFGGGLGSDGKTDGSRSTTLIQPTATATGTTVAGPAPTETTDASGDNGTIGTNCIAQGSSSGIFGGSENGVVDKNCCADITVIYARGTGEGGNVGTVSGPPMFKAIRSKLGSNRILVQGVTYPASAAGNANLGGDGGKIMAMLVSTAINQCPSSKIIVSGYSQGAMVVHNAFGNGLDASQVSGAILFGDPLKRQSIAGLSVDRVKQFCGTSDTICGGGGDGGATGSHLSYGSSAEAAAVFAIQAAGLA
ncbi:hypothetical protein ACN47E_000576 [Coniothyrium glycines]